MAETYAVLDESDGVTNLILCNPDTVDGFAASAGLKLRPAKSGDTLPPPEEQQVDRVTVLAVKLDRALAELAKADDPKVRAAASEAAKIADAAEADEKLR